MFDLMSNVSDAFVAHAMIEDVMFFTSPVEGGGVQQVTFSIFFVLIFFLGIPRIADSGTIAPIAISVNLEEDATASFSVFPICPAETELVAFHGANRTVIADRSMYQNGTYLGIEFRIL